MAELVERSVYLGMGPIFLFEDEGKRAISSRL